MAGVHPDDGRPEGEGRRNEIWRRVTETSLRSGVQVLYASDPGQPLTGRRNGDKVGFLGTRGTGRPRCPPGRYPHGGRAETQVKISKHTFCFRRLHESQAWAVRWRLSSGTLGRVMVEKDK
jgi:hypothetical protein